MTCEYHAGAPCPPGSLLCKPAQVDPDKVDQAARKLVAASGAAYRLGRIRDELVFAGFKTSSSPLLRKVRSALRSAEGAVRNAHGKLARAERAELENSSCQATHRRTE